MNNAGRGTAPGSATGAGARRAVPGRAGRQGFFSRVRGPGAGPSPRAEVLSVESATADVSITDVLTRRVEPKELTLRGVNLNLRVGADGKVLTTLPSQPAGGGGPVPRIEIDDARVN